MSILLPSRRIGIPSPAASLENHEKAAKHFTVIITHAQEMKSSVNTEEMCVQSV